MKPALNWVHTEPGTKLRYYRATILRCYLHITPHGWDVYYHGPNAAITERNGRFAGELPSVEECMLQAEAAARELMTPLKNSGELEQWEALWR